MSYLDRIRESNTHDLSRFKPFVINGERIGFIRHDFAALLQRWPRVFRVETDSVSLAPDLNAANTPVAERSKAVNEVVLTLRAEGRLGSYWWHEDYAVNRHFHQAPCLLIERAAIQLFGICGYGVHLNGFVRKPDGLHMWVGQRALSKPSGPGKLDQMVAGGQPANIGLFDNLIKECAEEAAIPESLARQAAPCGAVTYCLETAYGLRPDVLYVYDLELPVNFVPVNTDGEVEAFFLWPIGKIMELVSNTDKFKFNCSLVSIDFLIRHGYINPENPDYLSIISGLRYREQVFNGL